MNQREKKKLLLSVCVCELAYMCWFWCFSIIIFVRDDSFLVIIIIRDDAINACIHTDTHTKLMEKIYKFFISFFLLNKAKNRRKDFKFCVCLLANLI